jgi:hypothetical protein
MKWVVDGVAYNTATSTLLAGKDLPGVRDVHDRQGHVQATLYQTQKGAYFVHTSTEWWNPDTEEIEAGRDECFPMTAEEANAWLLRGNVKIIHNPFGEVPEAAAETEPGATIYLRVPATLKHRVDKAASAAGMSSNAWVMRCIEGCLVKTAEQVGRTLPADD